MAEASPNYEKLKPKEGREHKSANTIGNNNKGFIY